MSVVDIDRSKPFTKETGFAILSIVGLAAEELRGILTPEEAAEFTAWEQRNAVQGKEPPPEYTRGPCSRTPQDYQLCKVLQKLTCE